jgi:hypothetical protein
MAAAVDAGKQLGQRLTSGHDRAQVTQKVQAQMMAMFEAAV